MPDTFVELLAVEGLCGAAGCAAGTPPGDSRQRSQAGTRTGIRLGCLTALTSHVTSMDDRGLARAGRPPTRAPPPMGGPHAANYTSVIPHTTLPSTYL